MGEESGTEGACYAQGAGAGNCGGVWGLVFWGEGDLKFQNFKLQMEGERQGKGKSKRRRGADSNDGEVWATRAGLRPAPTIRRWRRTIREFYCLRYWATSFW
jgi:hypothetical protein